ncbi:hypothetical protein DITRI_Ditri03aG0115500 [Diplodiscus trichospermus]
MYSVNSFCRDYLKVQDRDQPDWKKVWSDLVPPKVATFCWQLLRGCIAVKTVLASRGLLQEVDIACPL